MNPAEYFTQSIGFDPINLEFLFTKCNAVLVEQGDQFYRMRNFKVVAALVILLANLVGCAAAATTVAGVGGSAAVTHAFNGITYRTFTASSSKVRTATLRALNRMQIKLVSDNLQEKTRVVTAQTNERKIEIQIEPVSPNTTRMRVVAKKSSLFYDAATAEEIIQQTKRLLG